MNTDKSITKIGVLLGSYVSDPFLYAVISELVRDKNIKLYFLLNKEESQSENTSLKGNNNQSFWESFSFLFYRIVLKVERKFFAGGAKNASLGIQNLEDFADEIEAIRISPNFSKSGLIVRYGEEDVERKKDLDLDLILRGNAPGIFKGAILKAAKEGILSFHHGDNRWNRGGPAAFWEVYYRKPTTGFIIQILNESLDGGKILLRGNFPTQRTFTENRLHLFKEANPYMVKIIRDYAQNKRLPIPEQQVPFDGTILKKPDFFQSFKYAYQTFGSIIKQRINIKLFDKVDRWGVAFAPSPWQTLSLSKGIRIKNPEGHFYADPFVATRENKSVCFVEDYDFAKKKGYITAIELLDKKNYKILGPIIEEDFHMSYPYLFEFQNELYMIPETSEARAIRLYKCVDFPMKWEYQKDLMKDIQTVDTTVFYFDSKWWLLTNKATPGNFELNSALFAYYSDSPLSNDWTPHQGNPLVLDAACGRNGGLLREGERVFRVRQNFGEFRNYGQSLSIAEIVKLTPTEFKENKIVDIKPDYFPKLKGGHHMFANAEFVVYDYKLYESKNK